MAHGSPISRHGRYDAQCIGMPMTETDSSAEYYRHSDFSSKFASINSHSRYHTQVQVTKYDKHSQQVNSAQEEIQTRPVSRRHGNTIQRHKSNEGSDDNCSPSPPSQLMVSPDSSHKRMQNFIPLPASSSGRPPTGGKRPSSSTKITSSHILKGESEISQITAEDFPEKGAVVRPSSSFSRYRPLPAIRTPLPLDSDESLPNNYSYDAIRSPSQDQVGQQNIQDTQEEQFAAFLRLGKKFGTKGISVQSDMSVISNHPFSTSQNPSGEDVTVSIEKLDLSQLEKPSPEVGRKKKTSYCSNKSNILLHQKQKVHSGDLYDGDDDDSDSSGSSIVSKQEGMIVRHHAKASSKKPVVIPSPDHPAIREVLLAVKLPTDGSRHQRYFNSNEMLQSIVDFAEEVAGQDFRRYILVVASAPKNIFVDLTDTIENVGLEDKTVLHLEEND